MLQVVHLTTVHSVFDVRIFHKQAKTLARAGYSVTLIAPHEKDEVIDGIRVIALPRRSNRLWRMLGVITALRKALRQKGDVYQLHDPELLPVGLLLKLLTRRKVVYDAHEDYPASIYSKDWIPPMLRRPMARAFNFFEKWAARRFDYVITATDHIRDKFQGDRVIAVKNYPPLPPQDGTQPPDKGGVPGVHTLIYVGETMGEARGIGEIVQAMEYLDANLDVKLKLLGRFSDAGFENRVRSLKGFEKVQYVGSKPWDEVFRHLAGADIGLVVLHPGQGNEYVHSLPVKLFEYMAVGLPVIASDFPLWKEIIESNHCGLTVEPRNPKKIAQAIEYLLNNPELRREMGENGKKAVIETYNWEKESEKLLSVYKRVLGRGT